MLWSKDWALALKHLLEVEKTVYTEKFYSTYTPTLCQPEILQIFQILHFMTVKSLICLSERVSSCVQLVYAILTASVMHLVSKYGHYERAVTGGLCAKLMADREGQKSQNSCLCHHPGKRPLHLLHQARLSHPKHVFLLVCYCCYIIFGFIGASTSLSFCFWPSGLFCISGSLVEQRENYKNLSGGGGFSPHKRPFTSSNPCRRWSPSGHAKTERSVR